VSVSTVLPTSTMSASQSPAFLVGQIFVRQNATTFLSFRQEHSSTDGVSTLQHHLSGTCFHHSFTHHPLVSLDLAWKPISSLRPTDTYKKFCWRTDYFTFTFICYIMCLMCVQHKGTYVLIRCVHYLNFTSEAVTVWHNTHPQHNWRSRASLSSC